MQQNFFNAAYFICSRNLYCRIFFYAEILYADSVFLYVDSVYRNPSAEEICMQILYAEIFLQQKFVCSFCIFVCRNFFAAEICMQFLYFCMQILYAGICMQKFVCSRNLYADSVCKNLYCRFCIAASL